MTYMAMADTEAVEPFVEFQYVRVILGTSSPAISEVLIDALAVEGAIIDLLAEAKLMDNAAILDAVKGARSESRKRQARVLLDKMVECRDWLITNFLFFLRTHQPGLLNIIEAGLLERVQKALESDWNNVADLVEQQEPPSEGGTALQEFAEARENHQCYMCRQSRSRKVDTCKCSTGREQSKNSTWGHVCNKRS